MSTFSSVRTQIQNLINLINTKTGKSATDITTAVEDLIGQESNIDISSDPGTIDALKQQLRGLINLANSKSGQASRDLTSALEPLLTAVDYSTSAILGLAMLGKMILGNSGKPKLMTPTIRLVTEELEQLETPIIRLETDELEKLDTPVIRLEVEDDPVLGQLAAPVIYVETDELPTLAAPVIYLEVDQLATPSIYLEAV